MHQEETIIAIATPPGVGALAIIRMSGIDAFSIIKKTIKNPDKFDTIDFRYASQKTIYDENQSPIDEVVLIKYKSPKSYTGEDLVEIISHGGYYTVKNLMDVFQKNGARLAKKGEFSKRAFLNGKIDLFKAEAINALIESKSYNEYITSIKAYSGNEKNFFESINSKIQNEILFADAEIEFGEEDLKREESRSCEGINEIIDNIKQEVKFAEKNNNTSSGIKIIIAGSTNAGKSSLFNALLGYKRAIVSSSHGTTRDIISEKIHVEGKEVLICDTAGLRETKDGIEKQGIKNSKKEINRGNIILWVTDNNSKLTKIEADAFNKIKKEKPSVIFNKSEGKTNAIKESFYLEHNPIKISLKKNINLEQLEEDIRKRIELLYSTTKIPNINFNQRKKEVIVSVVNSLTSAKENWQQKEIAAYYLKNAILILEELFGKTDREEVINNIFNKFCIGK